ncbi:MAG: LPS export ABC transporter permease LptF [Candidatus Binatia bacterium]
MGKVLCRYVFREVASLFFLALTIFTLILLTARILKLVELIVNRGVALWDIAKIFLYITPVLFEITVPMSFLLALLWGFGRLSVDREIIALKTCGISFLQTAVPVSLITVGVVIGTFLLTIYARPWSNAALRQAFSDIAQTRATAGLKEKTFNDKFDGVIIYTEEIHPPGTILTGIMIADSRDPQHRNTIFAREGFIITSETGQLFSLRLRDGTIHSTESARTSYHITHFSTYDLTINLPAILANANKEVFLPQEMPFHTLWEIVSKKNNTPKDINAELSEFHRRLSLPFSCVAFALIAFPLSIRRTWSFRANGFVLSLAIIVAYYLLLTLGEALGKKAIISPALALWLPNIGLGGVGLIIFGFSCWEESTLRRPI